MRVLAQLDARLLALVKWTFIVLTLVKATYIVMSHAISAMNAATSAASFSFRTHCLCCTSSSLPFGSHSTSTGPSIPSFDPIWKNQGVLVKKSHSLLLVLAVIPGALFLFRNSKGHYASLPYIGQREAIAPGDTAYFTVPPFHFIDENGEPFTDKDVEGKKILIVDFSRAVLHLPQK